MKENNLRDLFNYALEQDTKVRRGIIYSILNKIFDLAPPILIGIAIDIVVEGSDSFIGNLGYSDRRQQLIILAVLTFIIWGLESAFDYIAAVTWRNISQDIEHSLRTDAFNNVLGLDLAFFENKSSGRLMAILNDDVNQLETFLDNGANRLVQTATTVLVIGGTFLYISPLVAVFAFIPIPIIIFGSLRFTNRIAERYTKIRNDIENLNANLSNSITGILTVKSFNREKKESERITLSSNEVKSANYHAIRLSAAFIPIIRIAILFGFTATLLIGGFLALDGEIKVATYSVMLFITQRLLWPLTELGVIFDSYQKAMASFRRIINLKNTTPTIDNGNEKLTSFNKKIEISNLNFEYVKNFPVLNDISIDINKGQTTAIVGSTGSGKSTLIKLILRLYDSTSGEIKFDGKNIRDLELDSLRNKIGLVSQDIFLFEGTVFENIAYGNLDAKDEEVWEAAKLSESDKFINLLPNKENTIVGERGQKLSGGQRQRISIARAILKNPEILILDEATSAVDNETEAAIQRSINTLKEGRTVIAIAHRLSTIRNAEIIYVLEEGKVVESGNHESLLEINGVYSKLWSVQTGEKIS
ncbi:MAG: ABC transporter ATP-binding protein [Actinomycetota bacterium]|jgi:ATP-binding cassette subfamily B protein|nr:MAG: ABC transporter ATP-binding protein [Actinomycetota bacterium]